MKKKILKLFTKVKSFFIVIIIICIFQSCLTYQPLIFESKKVDIPAVSAEKLEFYVKTLSTDFLPRNYSCMKKLNAAAKFIEVEFNKFSNHVTTQNFIAGNNEFKNIIAKFPNNPQSDEWIIVGAHYDSYGNKNFPAADDNASGVAGILGLAELLKNFPIKKNIELVAYANEEPPFFKESGMGSLHHARFHAKNKTKVNKILILEMIGYFSDEENSQDYPISALKLLYPTTGNFIGIISNYGNFWQTRQIKAAMKAATDLPIFSINAPASVVQGIDFSDHWSYWQNGFDAWMISDTAFFRNKNYHTEADSYETLNYAKMAKVVQGVYNVLQY